jgi:hypothetical protein
MIPEETLGWLLELGKAWRVLKTRLEAKPSTLLLRGAGNAGAVAETECATGHPSCHPRPKSASRQFGSGHHLARERSSAMIELESPGQRCLPRTTTGDQHTPRADYRNFGADSLGGGDLSLGYIPLINLLLI